MMIRILTLLLSFCAFLSPTRAANPVEDLCYVLQPEQMTAAQLAAPGFDWLVLEPAHDSSWANSMFTPGEVTQIQRGGGCPTKVLAYLSIGEAEDYRDYWDPAWVDGQGVPIPGVAPVWLGPTNPDWAGNYKVRYWDVDWQAILFGTASGPDATPLDRIIDAGFDGVYMDIVDAYYYWSTSDGGNELTRMEARTRMIDLVEAIAVYARTTRGDAGFLVFPQNAGEMIYDDDELLDGESARYFAHISGIGVEDLFYDELSPQQAPDVAWRTAVLAHYTANDKTMLVTDYVIDAGDPTPGANGARVLDFNDRVRALGGVPYAALSDRALDEIVTLDGSWPVLQPVAGCAHPACPADLNGDGFLNIADVTAFIGAFIGGDPLADLNGDGFLNIADVTAFIDAFVSGC